MTNDITIFGTCRLTKISRNNRLCEDTTYTHCTKEIIQLYKFLNGECTFEYPYNTICFRTAIVRKSPVIFNSEFTSRLNQSKAFVIEICSRKKYIHNNIYLHHLSVDDRFSEGIDTPGYIKNEFIKEIQSDEEIENDIIELKKMIFPKPIILVSHYNSILDGNLITERNKLINLVEYISKNNNIKFLNPTNILKEYQQPQVMCEDLGHYTHFGKEKIVEYFNNYLQQEIFC